MTTKISLNFKDKTYDFWFGLSFLKVMYEEHNLDVTSIYNKMELEQFTFIPFIMYKSYVHAMERQKRTVELSELDLMDLLEGDGWMKDDKSCVYLFVQSFFNSIISKLPISEDVENLDTKKK